MTVSEMIQLLRGYPAGLRVVVNGYEDGYDDLSPEQISVKRIALNTGMDHWVGQHGGPSEASAGAAEPATVVDALVLCRTSN